MDPVFDAQFRTIKDDFASRGVEIDIAYTPAGEVDYLYAVGRLLAMVTPERPVDRLRGMLPGLRPLPEELQPRATGPGPLGAAGEGAVGEAGLGGRLMAFELDELDDGLLTVPEAVNLLERRAGQEEMGRALSARTPLVTPDHVMHITRLCPAVEPEVPEGQQLRPWPASRAAAGQDRRNVVIGVCDTGLLENLDLGLVPWMEGVTGEPDKLPPPLPDGRQRIPAFAGHGTFIAGVARCLAPDVQVAVTDHFSTSGAELESEMLRKLDQLAATGPDLICLSAGTYTRNNWTSLGFEDFRRRWPGITLVAAAGNESTDRPFYPAAFDWVIGVGALGADQQHRAWFSNYGTWVDVYAPGEGLVNAYATGEYSYAEPPRRPARQSFRGMARWSGTSFAAPVVAGLIAQRAAATGRSVADVVVEVLDDARADQIDGVGPALILDH
jgi:subtilisin family serine protease